MARKNNALVSKPFEGRRKRLLSTIMTILLVFYGVNYFNVFAVYLRSRADVQNSYCITPCPGKEGFDIIASILGAQTSATFTMLIVFGLSRAFPARMLNFNFHLKLYNIFDTVIMPIAAIMAALLFCVCVSSLGLEPLTQSPDREICILMLCATEITNITVVLNYQALVCLLIAHTAAMYEILSYEINQLNEFDEEGNETEYNSTPLAERKAIVQERLRFFIRRHCYLLETVQKAKDLYNLPIGVNFIMNAACIVFFFFLPSEEYVTFSPILIYCMVVFFLYCFLCQKLINATEMFERTVYSCGWENFEMNEKRVVYQMLVAAQKPVELIAAYIIPVNLATFASTCQFMYKFITVFKF